MDLFDRARKALGDLAESAGVQGRILQIQAELGQLENDLEREQREAGQIAYELWLHKRLLDADFDVVGQRIIELGKQIEAKRAEINAVQKGAQPERAARCGQCGRELAADDEFCRGCGARVEGR